MTCRIIHLPIHSKVIQGSEYYKSEFSCPHVTATDLSQGRRLPPEFTFLESEHRDLSDGRSGDPVEILKANRMCLQ
jgi:hypothetical protein